MILQVPEIYVPPVIAVYADYLYDVRNDVPQLPVLVGVPLSVDGTIMLQIKFIYDGLPSLDCLSQSRNYK